MAGGYVAFLNHCYNSYNYMPHNYRLTKQVQFVQLFGAEHQKQCLELNANIGMLTCWKWCYCACSPHIPCVWSCAVRVMSAWPQRVCACKAGRERDADKQKAAGLHPLGPRSCLTDAVAPFAGGRASTSITSHQAHFTSPFIMLHIIFIFKITF